MRHLLQLTLALLAALSPSLAAAQQPMVPWPGVTLPTFVMPASAVNGGGVVTSPQLLAPDGTAGAPSYSFANATTSGDYRFSGGLARAIGGSPLFSWTTTTHRLHSTVALEWSTDVGVAGDVSLSRGAANRLDLASGDSFNLVSGSYLQNNVVTFSTTAPTISSGFGTSPSIPANNGTAAFTINVGTGGTASTGVIGFPAATTGWHVQCNNTSANTATVFITKQTAFTTTTATIGNYDAAGAAAAWTASNVLVCSATAF